MKKILYTAFALVAFAFIISSCSSTQGVQGGSTNVSRGKFTGTWTLNNVSYEGLVENAVQNVFDQAPPRAFAGSTWKLTNSGNGVYTLADGSSQTIFWSVNNSDPAAGQMFQFKKIFEGDKARNVDTGYKLVVASNNGTDMTLKSPVSISGGTGYVVYTFTKQ
jgi:hypothetical protein